MPESHKLQHPDHSTLSAVQLIEEFGESLKLSHISGPLDSAAAQNLSSPSLCNAQSLVFTGEAKHLQALLSRRESHHPPPAIAILSPALVGSLTAEHQSYLERTCLLQTPKVTLALALISRKYFAPNFFRKAFDSDVPIHPTAAIHPSARVDPKALVGPYAVIGPDVVIESGAVVGSHCHVEEGAWVKARSHLHSNVYLGPQTQVGEDCEIHPFSCIGTEGFGYAHDDLGQHHRIPHLGRVILEDGVHIGANVSMDRGTLEDSVVGSGTKIDNHCHFGHNFRCGKNCLITGGFISAGSVTLGDQVVVGGRTTVSGHLEVASHVQLAGLTGVPKTLTEPGAYGGYPPQPVKEHLRTTASLTHLPEMRKDLARIKKHLKLDN